MVITVQRADPSGVWSFLGWAAVGVGLSIAVLTPLTIGPWVAIAAVAVIIGLLVSRSARGAGLAGCLRGRPPSPYG